MRIHPSDNVEVRNDGQKYAIVPIKAGENVIKYGFPIGHAKTDIAVGDQVSPKNLASNLAGLGDWVYAPYTAPETDKKSGTFMGYRRKNGDVGIRNELWIVPTVGCSNGVAKMLAEKTGAKALTHPYGCSQLGDDMKVTQKILSGLIRHPNAGGVLVLGLGCENNGLDALRKVLGEDYDHGRVRFLNLQDCNDEIAEGTAILDELKALMATDKREPLPISSLRIAVKCGGSDGYSGITANPLVGRVSDKLISMGGSCVLTEVPEMFGAEHLLMARAESEEVFNNIVSLINDFKEYYERHNQVIYENPSPGNKKGGITTLEEKSLGCVQKAGSSAVVDVLDYGDTLRKNGLSLLNGPGNDIVAITNLFAAGVHIILFTTGRGTPVGSGVPTVKIATNNSLATRKSAWIDFDASPTPNGKELTDELFDYITDVANGKETNNEIHGYKEISIFKDGVTL